MAQARFFQEWGDVEPPEWKRTAKTKDRVWEAVESYFTQYAPKTNHIQPYITSNGRPSVEYTFAVPSTPRMASRLTLRVRHSSIVAASICSEAIKDGPA